MEKPGATGIARIVNAARYSALGFGHAWRHEAAFRQEVALMVVLVPLGYWLGVTPFERAVLIASCLLVLIVELLNSAIEAAIDRFGGARHELSGRAKDLGSAAVFVSLVLIAVLYGSAAWQRFGG